MMKQAYKSRTLGLSPFIAVDADENPKELIHFLDTVATTLTYKPKAYQVLKDGIQTGDSVLDAGCGSGYDFLSLAEMVGQTGIIVGVDSSEKMLEEAQNQCQLLDLSVVQLFNADLHALPFSMEKFNGCRVDRVLQHVETPMEVLVELARVLKPHGILVASEPDWDAWVIHPSGDITKKITEFKRDKNIRNGHIASDLPNLLEQLGFENIQVFSVVDKITDFTQFTNFMYLVKYLDIMRNANAITEEEIKSWLNMFKHYDQEGTFISYNTTSIIRGYKK